MTTTVFYTYQCKFYHSSWWNFYVQPIIIDLFPKLCQAQPPFACRPTHSMQVAEYLGAVLVPCNSLLFLLRVRAVSRHARSRMVLYLCTFLWILTFLSFFIPFGIKKTSIPTQEDACIFTYDRKFISIPFIAVVVFDTAVMVASLVGFVARHDTSWYLEMKATIMMRNVGPASQAFLRSGYIYFLFVFNNFFLPVIKCWPLCYRTVIGIHITSLTLVLSSSLAPIYLVQLIPTIGLIHNIMTCRAFRLLRLSRVDGIDQLSSTSTSLSSPIYAVPLGRDSNWWTLMYRVVSKYFFTYLF